MQNTRREGFIIRKAVHQNPSNISAHEQRRYMSQTQFYRKSTPTSNVSNINNLATPRRFDRSPGHIVHVQLKKSRLAARDLDLSKGYIDGLDDDQIIDHNPESYGTQLKYQYLQSATDLKQVGDTQQQLNKIHDKSFQQIQLPTGLAAKTNLRINENIQLHGILHSLHYSLQHPSQSQTHQVLQLVQNYLEYLQKNDSLNNVNNLPLPLMRRKILKESLTIQRYAVSMVGLITAIGPKDKMQDSKAFLVNLVGYTIDNLLLRLAILTEGTDKQVVQLLKEQKKQKLLNKGFETVKNNNQIMQQGMIKLASLEKAFYDVYKKMYKQNKTLDIKSQLFTFRQFIAYYLCESQRSELCPFLSLCPAPYLPSQELPRYTLAIDAISVFLPYTAGNTHRFNGNKSAMALGGSGFRPFAEYFLDEMSQYFEIVSYCDTMPEDANRVISLLDRKKHIKYRLFRHHVNKMKGLNGKDLTRLGRELDKVVMIDTNKDVEDLNTIVISPWKGKKNDAELAELCSILAMIAVKKLNPQKSIKKLQEKNEQNMKIGLKHLNCGINLQ